MAYKTQKNIIEISVLIKTVSVFYVLIDDDDDDVDVSRASPFART